MDQILGSVSRLSPHIACPICCIAGFSQCHPNVHHRTDDGGSPLGVGPNPKPLENDEKVHVAEEEGHEDNLRQELKVEVKGFFKVAGIVSFDHNSDYHMKDANDN